MHRPLVLAHRGARRAEPENTLAAFAAARALGADGVELDARRTRDGRLVVHHDPRPRGGPLLAGVALAEVRAAFPAVPTLAEALDECRGLLVNVELKNGPREPGFDRGARIADDLVTLLRDRGAGDRVLVSSFHLPTLDRVRALDATLPTALLFGIGSDPWKAIARAARHGHRAVHPPVLSLGRRRGPRVVGTARAHGLAVNVWTVNDPDDVVRLAALGVDGLVTDVPDVALAALARDGQSTGRTNGNASGS